MKQILPQEIEVWYLIPALRRELAKILVKEHKLKQNQAANILGITNAAISQYLKSKRGQGINFNEKETELIKKAAEEIVKDKGKLIKNLYKLCETLRKSKTICEIHKIQDKNISKNCDVCFKS